MNDASTPLTEEALSERAALIAVLSSVGDAHQLDDLLLHGIAAWARKHAGLTLPEDHRVFDLESEWSPHVKPLLEAGLTNPSLEPWIPASQLWLIFHWRFMAANPAVIFWYEQRVGGLSVVASYLYGRGFHERGDVNEEMSQAQHLVSLMMTDVHPRDTSAWCRVMVEVLEPLRRHFCPEVGPIPPLFPNANREQRKSWIKQVNRWSSHHLSIEPRPRQLSRKFGFLTQAHELLRHTAYGSTRILESVKEVTWWALGYSPSGIFFEGEDDDSNYLLNVGIPLYLAMLEVLCRACHQPMPHHLLSSCFPPAEDLA